MGDTLCGHGERMDAEGLLSPRRNPHGVYRARQPLVELGLELQGEAPVEGDWVDRVVGLEGVRAQIAILQTPDGHGRLKLTKFHTPRLTRC